MIGSEAENAIVRRAAPIEVRDQHWMPIFDPKQAVERFQQLQAIVKGCLKDGTDFGAVPGTDKPTLLKPGAEKLCTMFGLSAVPKIIERVEDWTGKEHCGEPFFYYLYRCSLYRGELLICEADGSANSRESKYRWRWVKESELPPGANKAMLATRRGCMSEPCFAVERKETGGQYGKPAEYWAKFEQAIAEGTATKEVKKTRNGRDMECWVIDSTLYRVPNEDLPSQVNTLQKMAQKRAYVAAVLIAVNASEYFTQDVEDLDYAVPDSYSNSHPIESKPTQAPTQTAAPSNPSPEMELANLRSAAQAALQACAKAAGGGAAGRTAAVEALKRITGKSKVGEVSDAAALRRLINALGKAQQRISGNGGDAGDGGPDLSSWETFYNTIIEAAIGQVTPKQAAEGMQKALQLTDMDGNWEDTSLGWRKAHLDAVKAKKFNWSTGEIEE